MNIGQASRASGVSAKMIRYYEQNGLIPKALRRDSGYRDYDESDIHRLRFIRRARDLGFTVEQIRDLLALWSDRERSSSDVKSLALGHVERLRAKQIELEQMIETLEALARDCHGDDRPDCPIIEGLAEVDASHCSSGVRHVPRFGVTGRVYSNPATRKLPR